MKRFVWLPVSLCLLCVFCLATLLAAPEAARADGALSSTPDQQPWVTNDTVYAIATGPDGITYIGGGFTYVGPNTGGGAALDATSGAPDMSFPQVEGTVEAAVSDGAGGYYIGGVFTRVGGVTRNGIAHILPDGSVDPAFDPNANDSVLALAVSGSTVYAGGIFTSIGGQTRNNIAALTAGSGLATTWDPNADKEVDALARLGLDRLRRRLVHLDRRPDPLRHRRPVAGSGLATTWDPNAGNAPYGNANVSALAVSGSTVYAGGWFTSIGGQSRSGIAAVSASSGSATAWNPKRRRHFRRISVLALAVSGSTVYAGGFFTSIGGQTRNYIAALDAGSGLATAWNPSADGTVRALAVSGSTVYAGGNFTSIGGQTRHGIAALDATSGAATTWNPNPVNGVATAPSTRSPSRARPSTPAATSPRSAARTRNHIAALDATRRRHGLEPERDRGDWRERRRPRRLGLDRLRRRRLHHDRRPDPQRHRRPRRRAAASPRPGTRTRARRAMPGLSPRRLGLDRLRRRAVHHHRRPDAQPHRRPRRRPAASPRPGIPTRTPTSSRPRRLGLDRLRRRLLHLDRRPDPQQHRRPRRDQRPRHALGPQTPTERSTPSPSRARPSTPAATSPRSAARAATTSPPSTRPPASPRPGTPTRAAPLPEVNALAVSGSTVYVGGEFTTIGGQARNDLAALDASSGLATAWDPNAGDPSYSTVYALAVSGSTVYAGGNFTSIGGHYQPYLARFSSPTPPTVTSPNGGETWTLVSTHDITWDAGNGGKVNVELSRDDGSSWETLFASTANDGSESWTVSGPTTSQALVRISNEKGSGSSTAPFTIAPALTGSMSLDGGAAYATSTAVTIDSSVSGVTQMRFENAGGSWSTWEAYNATKAWTLPSGDGAKTVEAQYRDADDNVLDLSADVTLDSTPPVTTNDAPTGWKNASVTVHLSPTDAGSGMTGGSAKTEYSTDGGTTWTTGTSLTITADPVAHTTDGITTINYRSVDNAGNVAAVQTCRVELDTRKPITKAPSCASARRGRTATLKYRANDLPPNGGTATVTIKVKTLHGTLKKTLRCGVKAVNTTLTVRFKVPLTWKAGTYRFFVYAIDAAGNAQAKVGS